MNLRTLSIALPLIAGLACSGTYRKETLGVAPVLVGAQASDMGVEIVERHDQVQVSYVVTTPSAIRLHYKVSCPGQERSGTIGESAVQYRERRLAEIERARQQEVQNKAAVVSALVGSAEGQAQGSAGPVHGQASVGVDGQALGQKVGESTTAAAVLPAWDVGAQELKQTLMLHGGEAGTCSMSIWPEDTTQAVAGIVGSIKVVQFINKERVKREDRAAADEAAIVVRANLRASLVAGGADPQYREKLRLIALQKEQEAQAKIDAQARIDARLKAEAQAKIDAQARIDARLKAEAQAKIDAEAGGKRHARAQNDAQANAELKARLRADVAPLEGKGAAGLARDSSSTAASIVVSVDAATKTRGALTTRGRLQAWCIGNGGDPYYRARQRQAKFDQEQAAEQKKVEAQWAVQARKEEERKKFEIQLGLDLRTRTALVATLMANGADPDYRRKRDMADLRAFEARALDAKYDRIRASNRDGGADASTSVDGSVGVASSGGSLGSSALGGMVVTQAVTRPPVPAPPTVRRPKQPSAKATWIAGFYEWQAGAWLWTPGLWSVPPKQDAIWVPAVEINVGGNFVFQPGSWRSRSGKRVRAKVQSHDHRKR